MVGDPLEVEDDHAYTQWYREKFKRNIMKIQQNFELFETLLFRLYYDPEIKFSQLYPLGFSGGWDSPLYFVGYYIGRTIEQYKGRDLLVELLKKPPLEFFKTYIDIYMKNPDKNLMTFSSSVNKILNSL